MLVRARPNPEEQPVISHVSCLSGIVNVVDMATSRVYGFVRPYFSVSSFTLSI